MERKIVEEHIMNIINKYTPILLVDNFTFKLEYKREADGTIAEAKFNFPYLNFTLIYTDILIRKYKKGNDIEPFIVHELVHAITDPLYAVAMERFSSCREINMARERLTDHICNIALKKEKLGNVGMC
jgi:hypothetical protein